MRISLIWRGIAAMVKPAVFCCVALALVRVWSSLDYLPALEAATALATAATMAVVLVATRL